MALFDGLLADDTTKDEFGMTQAERRQPLWAGLIKAGLLGVAAGGEMMPQDRARAIGQIGGAIGDIPGEMMQYRAGAAQQALRGQQVAESKFKVAQRQKVQALAETPEFQKDIANLPPHIQQIIRIQIEAGDMDAVSRTIANANTLARQEKQDTLSERRENRLAGHQDTEEQRRAAEFEWKKQEAERKARLQAEQAGGWGNGPEGQAREKLLKGRQDPEYAKTADYAQAWHFLNTDRPFNLGGAPSILPKLPDIGDYPKPSAAPAPGSPNAVTPPPAVEVPKEKEVRVNPDGSKTWFNKSSEEIFTEWPDGSLRVTDKDTGTFKRSEQPKPIPESAQKELADAKGFREQMKVASAEFLRQWKAAEGTDRLKSLVGLNTPLNRAWRNTMLFAKGKNMYELGVLNKGDLPQLQMALADPSSLSSAFSTDEQVEADLKAMMDLTDAKIGGTEKALHEGRLRAPKAGGGGGGKRTVKQFKDGKIVEVEID